MKLLPELASVVSGVFVAIMKNGDKLGLGMRNTKERTVVYEMAKLSYEARLREVVKLANETLPVLRSVLSGCRAEVPLAELHRLETQNRLQGRLLALALYTLSNLPDDQGERDEALASTLRLCSALATQN